MSSPSPDAGGVVDSHLRNKLERAVARALPAWARAHLDDIVQAAMLRVIRVREKREGKGPLPASYLWKVAYTATIDELRRLRARPDHATETGEAPDLAESEAVSPERRTQADEIADGIRDCLSGLADTRRQAVALYLAGHTVPETGRVLGWGTKKAENMVYRGLADMRKCLGGKGIEP